MHGAQWGKTGEVTLTSPALSRNGKAYLFQNKSSRTKAKPDYPPSPLFVTTFADKGAEREAEFFAVLRFARRLAGFSLAMFPCRGT